MATGTPVTRSTRAGWSFLLPFLVVYLLFVLYPVVQAVWMGFFERDLLTIDRQSWIGFDNYQRMLWGDGLTWQLDTMWPWRLAGLLTLIPAYRSYRRGGLSLTSVHHPGRTGRACVRDPHGDPPGRERPLVRLTVLALVRQHARCS